MEAETYNRELLPENVEKLSWDGKGGKGQALNQKVYASGQQDAASKALLSQGVIYHSLLRSQILARFEINI